MITKFIPKDQKRGVEDAAIRNNEMGLYIPPHLVLRPSLTVDAKCEVSEF